MKQDDVTIKEVISVLKWVMACRSNKSSAMDFLAANEKALFIIERYEDSIQDIKESS